MRINTYRVELDEHKHNVLIKESTVLMNQYKGGRK